ncbi:uncharacterized protein LOC122378555 [Amphibalanus amphitrite]|uniref:uncharacterized protein LOC122378555 n=1 Tax=Amphibalanus amphitrite TaxID=1232801 RepID=UPI001C8FEB52|nr:uncharacterized protein LOC122378555 [Amphibalanus amphitrite]
MILGMTGISALGGVSVKGPGDVRIDAVSERVPVRPAGINRAVARPGGVAGAAVRSAPATQGHGGAVAQPGEAPAAARPARAAQVIGGTVERPGGGEAAAAGPARAAQVIGGTVARPGGGEVAAAGPARAAQAIGCAAARAGGGEGATDRPAQAGQVTGGTVARPGGAKVAAVEPARAASASRGEGAGLGSAAATASQDPAGPATGHTMPGPRVGGASTAELVADAKDFTARFDVDTRSWTVAWKWADGVAPDCLTNRVAEYRVPPSARQEYDEELETWLRNGWLQPYNEAEDGPPRGLVPLMAVPQAKKVRPVLDMRELNGHVAAYTADSDVCADRLRKWRRHGRRVAVVDLRRAYLQLRLDRKLWPYQTVIIRGERFCLTRLGFGLNVAPAVMKAVVRLVMAQDAAVERAVCPYVDDLLVDEAVVSAEHVVEHFERFGLECKPPARAEDGARMLGLHVRRVAGELRWSRDSAVPDPPDRVTRRSVFAWCGRLVAHLPVCGWLRPAAAWVKRRANAVTRGWDDVTTDALLQSQISHVHSRLLAADPARGQWCWTGDQAIVWTDASSIAAGVVIETPCGGVMEDACWLRPGDAAATHINMAELDAAVRGLNLAVAWGVTNIDLRTDSATVHRWVDDALSGRARLRTRAAGEMLIRRRVDLIRQLANELELKVTVTLVRSEENLADALTRVPKEWLRDECEESRMSVTADDGAGDSAARGQVVVGAGAADAVRSSVQSVHERAGHPGVRRTLFFARRDVSRDVTRALVRAVVTTCDVCRSIDPAPVRWRHGSLEVAAVWERVAMDVTHHQGRSYLTVIDCGPTRFTVWRPLGRADAVEVTGHLEQIFFERGAPKEILADNDTVFRGRRLASLVARWGIALRFRAVHEPGGNGVVERCHRTVKVIAARRRCPVSEAVHLYNVTPRDGRTADTAPAAGVYRYAVRDCVRPGHTPVDTDGDGAQPAPALTQPTDTRLRVGDRVWVRRRGTRCTETSQRGTVTGELSEQVLEVDGVPWHVRNLRPRYEASPDSGDDSEEADESPPLLVGSPPAALRAEHDALDGAAPPDEPQTESHGIDGTVPPGEGSEPFSTEGEPAEAANIPPPRHSERARRPPPPCSCCTQPE